MLIIKVHSIVVKVKHPIFKANRFIQLLINKSPKKMDRIENVSIAPLTQSMYVKPIEMHYKQDNKQKKWDLLAIHDSVAVIIFNNSTKKLLFVKQFRPAVYLGKVNLEERSGTISTEKYPAHLGMTIELCAGIVDKKKSLQEIAREEILEECGYDVPLDTITPITSYCADVGVLASVQTIYYCEVDDSMKVAKGGGIDDEFIEVVQMDLNELKEYISQPYVPSPPSFLNGINWFLLHKSKLLQ